MTVLFITRSPLARSNSTGQTLCNFFDRSAFPEGEHTFHVLTLTRGATEPAFAADTLAIGNKDLLCALPGRPLPTPRSADRERKSVSPSRISGRIKENTTLRTLSYIPRNLLWAVTAPLWKRAVRAYVATIRPDVIFFPTSGQGYHHRVLEYVCTLTDARIVLYHGDDHYTPSGSHNPVFRIRRCLERARIRRAVSLCHAQLGASEAQCTAYASATGKRCIFISKSGDFSRPSPPPAREANTPLSFVYTGNILLGRWESLVYLGRLLDRLAEGGNMAALTVYSGNSLTPRMEAMAEGVRSIRFAGCVPPDALPAIWREADVLVHAESFTHTHRAIVRYSFSTKIVDYLAASRPILAVGPSDVASVAYLSDHNAALCLPVEEDIALAALTTLFDHSLREILSARAWELGCRAHTRAVMHRRLMEALAPPQ